MACDRIEVALVAAAKVPQSFGVLSTVDDTMSSRREVAASSLVLGVRMGQITLHGANARRHALLRIR